MGDFFRYDASMKRSWLLNIISTLGSLFFFGCFVVLVLALGVVVHYSRDLPDYRQLEDYKPLITTRLYAGNGQRLMEYATERRIFVPIESVPEKLKQAFISAEDKNFYQHNGVDFWGVLRALMTNVGNIGESKRLVGASTITQQVAKNFFLTNEKSFSRKIKEALLARKMENAFDKNHILELYLNQIFLGMRSYGVAAAALAYFDKSLDELDLSEMAFLAGLPKGPNNYNPVKNPEGAKARRDYVLDRMYSNGYITEQEKDEAQNQPLVVAKTGAAQAVPDADFYSEEIRRLIVEKYGDDALYQGGLAVRAAIDPTLQAYAVKALRDGLFAYDKRHGYRGAFAHIKDMKAWEEELPAIEKPVWIPDDWQLAVVLQVKEKEAVVGLSSTQQGTVPLSDITWARKALGEGRISDKEVKKVADVLSVGDVIFVQQKQPDVFSLKQFPEVEGALVALDPHTGRVLAMAGGLSFQRSQFNRATQAYRQPGSSFKPFVYLTALDSGFTPSSLILDAPLVVDQGPGQDKWKPRNYTKIFYGMSTLRTGIEKSRNLMTIRLAQAVGIEKTVEYARKFGIMDNMLPVLSMSLGSGETTLLKLTSAYASLVNGGKKVDPYFIDRIQDRSGKTIYRYDTRECPNCQGPDANPFEVPQLADTHEQIQDPVSAYQMVNIMTGVVERGTGRIAQTVKRTLAAKSGTSNDNVDTWFLGFSPDLVVGVWVGFDQPKTLGPRDTGSVVAAPIFRDFMAMALKDKPDIPFRVPEGVRLVRVNYKTGKPAQPGDEVVILEAFRQDTDLSTITSTVGEAETSAGENTPEVGGLY